jgi:four helix bundle protein
MSDICFDHERLDVYRVAIAFSAWVGELLETLLADCKLSAVNQLDRASTSIPLNIAEGNGKRSAKDRCRYLDTSRGSAFECAAALDILVARKRLTPEQIAPGKALLRREVEMLSRLTAKLLGHNELANAPR